VLDGTAGAGGHSLRLTEAGSEVLALDRDPQAVAAAGERLAGRSAHVRQLDFVDAAHDAEVRAFRPDGVLLDLGLSSPQIDDESRGFTFRPGAPLDMRMEGNGQWAMGNGGMTAADWLNSSEEAELEHVFKDYGDERRARALVRQVVKRRATRPFVVSDDLVNAIRATLGPQSGPPDFARLFQAVRIAVNGELDRLERALPELFELLALGGVIAVIAYHSGEDRIVKHLFRDWARVCVCPEEQPMCTCRNRSLGDLLTRHPIEASDVETARNPRSRSAKLRAFRKAA
jgi:16S rRNA (cytosine1402-N4)-methyltransferase